MAKRNKKLKNVQISNEELVPTTIGYLETRQKGPFLLIFIFAVLFATLYFMPQITVKKKDIKIVQDGSTLYATTKGVNNLDFTLNTYNLVLFEEQEY